MHYALCTQDEKVRIHGNNKKKEVIINRLGKMLFSKAKMHSIRVFGTFKKIIVFRCLSWHIICHNS